MGSGDLIGYQGLTLDWPCVRQAPFLLCYGSGLPEILISQKGGLPGSREIARSMEGGFEKRRGEEKEGEEKRGEWVKGVKEREKKGEEGRSGGEDKEGGSSV